MDESAGPAPEALGADPERCGGLASLLANVTVLTALLVHFGWQRHYAMTDRLGIE